MYLEKRPNGVWYYRFKQEGTWKRRSLKTQNKREAQHRLTQLDLTKPRQERLTEAVKRWLKEQEQRELTPRHFSDIKLTARELTEAFGNRLKPKIQRSHLLPWIQEKPRRLSLTRAFFRWSIADGLRLNDPCLGIARYIKKPERIPTPRLSDLQIRALLDDLQEHSPKLYPLVRFLSETGVRSADAARLHWRDVGEGRLLIKPGKGKGHTRFIPATIDLPTGHSDSPVFGLTKSQLEGTWRRFKMKHVQWKGASLHSLRVAVNSRLVEQGQEALARAMLGHSSVDMTAHYTRLHGGSQSSLKKASLSSQ